MTVNQQEIANLKKSVEEARNRCQAITDNVRILLQTNRERFTTQLKSALDKGWMAWVAQAAELHTYRADWENRRKDGRGFYKLNEESIVAVREDLAQDYRTLADQHSEELAQLLDDFGESQEDLFHQITQAGSTRTNEESIAIPIPDTAEQEEPQPMSPEITTTVDSTERQAEPPAIPESEILD